MIPQRGRTLSILALATAGCLWGTGFYFGKIALSEMPVAAMVLFRFVFACAGLLPVIFFDHPRFNGKECGWVLAASVLGVPVQYLVQFEGLSLTTVSHASLMVGTLPMLLAIAAVLFSGEQLHFGGWVALAASTLGAGLIALSSKKRLRCSAGEHARRRAGCALNVRRRVPASQAGIFVNLEPLVGAILGVSVLHEVLGNMALAGGALIIGGAVYFSYKPEKTAGS